MKETEERQDEIQISKDPEDKLLSTLTGITWVAAIVAFGAIITNNIGMSAFVAFSIASITGFLIKPLIILLRESKKRLISFKEKSVFGIKSFIVFISILCTYMIFASPYYDLYWSYWGLLTALLLLALMGFIERKYDKEKVDEEEVVEDKGSRKKLFKKVKRVAYFLFSILLAVPNIYQIYTPKQIITLEDLAMPSYIDVREIDELEAIHGSGALLYQNHESVHIVQEDKIRSVIEALEGVIIENIRFIEELNYLKMKRIEAPYYSLYVAYEGISIFQELRDQEDNVVDTRRYIYGIEVYPNGRVYVEMATNDKRMFQIFPVEISNEIIEKLLEGSMI